MVSRILNSQIKLLTLLQFIKLSPTTGRITVNRQLDREANSRFSFTITAQGKLQNHGLAVNNCMILDYITQDQ